MKQEDSGEGGREGVLCLSHRSVENLGRLPMFCIFFTVARPAPVTQNIWNRISD